MNCTVSLDKINTDLLQELNKIPSPTSPDERYSEMKRELVFLKNELKEINKNMCILVHRISTLQTRLNLVDDRI